MIQSHTKSFLKPYNFNDALSLSPDERCQICVERIEEEYTRNGLGCWEEVPMVPPIGATQQELEHLESAIGFSLPPEYAQFLRSWCYLNVTASGLCVWGTNYKGIGMGTPWVSENHRTPCKYLVFADYWNFADGDQLMFDLNDNKTPVVAYLHEHNLIEYFAPSFSLALWRMTHE